MLTVIVGLDGSGNISTRRPLGRRYSVMPSTSVTLTGFTSTGRTAARWPGLRAPLASTGVTVPVLGAAAVAGCAWASGRAAHRATAARRRIIGIGYSGGPRIISGSTGANRDRKLQAARASGRRLCDRRPEPEKIQPLLRVLVRSHHLPGDVGL